jgi:O-antigen/teichoic acid export membrane protein
LKDIFQPTHLSNLKKKTYKAFIWDFTGKFALQAIGFVISIILARLLTPKEFGLLAIASVIISFANVFIDGGLSTSLIQRKEVTDEHYGSVFFFNLIMGAILMSLVMLSAHKISTFYNQNEIGQIIQVLSFSFLINAFGRVQTSWLTKQLKFEVITKARVASVVLSGSLGITLAYLGYGVWALVFQNILGGLVNNIYIFLLTGWKPKLKFQYTSLIELWGYGGNMLLARIFSAITDQADKIIIGKIFSANILGYYYRAQSLNQFITRFTSGTFMSVLFPVLSDVQNENDRFLKIIEKALTLLSFISFFLVGLLFITAEDVFILLFSKKWIDSVQYFKILVTIAFIYPISTLLVNILLSKGNSKKNLKLNLIKQSLILTNLIIGFSFGLKEYLLGFVIVNIIGFIINISFASKEIEASKVWFYKKMYKYFISSFIAILCCVFIKSVIEINSNIIHFLLFTLIFTFIYLSLLILFRANGPKLLLNEAKNLNRVF